jgi:hypothetical protein
MIQQPPLPVCKAFLVCCNIVEDNDPRQVVLAGLPRFHQHHCYPNAPPLAFFARVTSAHGDYVVEIQLQTPEGEVVWTDGPGRPWAMPDPLLMYDLTLSLCPVFPVPGIYDFILLANGQEVARQPFKATLTPATVQPQQERPE